MGMRRKSKAMWGINAIRRYDKDLVDVTVLGNDETLAKMSRGGDVAPYLNSRNTKGHGNLTQILEPKVEW